MNVEIGTEAPIFLFCEYLFQIFYILSFSVDACNKFTLYCSNFLYNNIKIKAEGRNTELRQKFILKGIKINHKNLILQNFWNANLEQKINSVVHVQNAQLKWAILKYISAHPYPTTSAS
jgi:hypothetical protein